LVARTKQAIFHIFREIPKITNKAKESQIIAWKQSAPVKSCFSKLYKRVKPEDSETHLKVIINYVFLKKEAKKIQIAFVMSICELLLDSTNNYIKLSEEVIKQRFEKNLVSF